MSTNALADKLRKIHGPLLRFTVAGQRILVDCKLPIVPNDIKSDLPAGWMVRDDGGYLIVERAA